MTVNWINKTWSIWSRICLLLGVVEALLLGRVVGKLLAARPDNPFVGWLYTFSAPLRWPLAVLDAGQPLFGARLEFSSLAMAGIVLVVGYLLWRIAGEPAAK